MKIDQVIITTGTATSGMNVRDFIDECTRANIPGLPFTTPSGRISGRVTLKNIFRLSCLPDYIIESARFLTDQSTCMEDIEANAAGMMDKSVETFVQEPHLSLTSDDTALKALAMMEQSDTSYIFVVDEGQYRGVITIQSIARALARADTQA